MQQPATCAGTYRSTGVGSLVANLSRIALVCLVLLLMIVGPANAAPRVVSLDYCADQYVVKLVKRADVLALSSDATRAFSYVRKQAASYPTVRTNAESVLALAPDTIVRSYGGGANASAFYTKLGINVVQIGFSNSIQDIQQEILRLAKELDNEAEGRRIVDEMQQRLTKAKATISKDTLYVTPSGVTTGSGTLMHDIIVSSGHKNFEKRAGWRSIPLETLSLTKPEQIATAFYDDTANVRNYWSASRHPIIRRQIEHASKVILEGATTACGGWFLLDAVERLAANET